MLPAPSSPQTPPLPELRQDLQLYRALGSQGKQSWLIYDPIRHRYFHISQRAFRLMSIWRPEPAPAFMAYASEVMGSPVTLDEITELATFIFSSSLSLNPPGGDAASYAKQEKATNPSLFWKILHNYLFFRIPLVRPEKFLEAALPLVSVFFTFGALYAIAAISLAGLYFASRQWEQFLATFLDFLSLEGALAYGVTLFFIKILHELGHAYTATRLGVRVNTMGVAFIVMMPVLYTDVTDSWRLRRRREKLAIDAAGMIVELSLAGMALLLWAFLPDGPVRSAAYLTAAVSLFMGLAINLNPLMRFDGYYLLADALNIPNLLGRSTRMGRWFLRERLFRLRRPPPERASRRKKLFLVCYAGAMFVYRQFLFIGIALAVYHMAFKALGVILFMVEIGWFVILPILRELKEWWHMKGRILSTRRTRITAALLAIALMLFFLPWRSSITMQAVVVSEPEFVFFTPRPARIQKLDLEDGAAIRKGSVLMILDSAELDHEVRQAQLETEQTRRVLDRIAGDKVALAELPILKERLARNEEKLAGLERERQRLVIRAPFDGLLRDVDVDLRVGNWLDDRSAIARLVAASPPMARGYIDEDQYWRISPGDAATFIPEDFMLPKLQGKVGEIARVGSDVIELPYLASVYGGNIPTDQSPDGRIIPRKGWHLIRVTLQGERVRRVMRGTLHISGLRESMASATWRQILRVLVRESST
ncbi:MAG: HlyD family efflux transporter periplasmic adaptor subunit [Hyphomicrobiaceae bacterium]